MLFAKRHGWIRLQVLALAVLARCCEGIRAQMDEQGVIEKLSWPLFSWKGAFCGSCSGIPAEELKTEEDFAVSCISKDAGIPTCPVASSLGQAGGHAGTILALGSGRLAKETLAFANTSAVDKRKIVASSLEWQNYMEMWCLRRLLQNVSDLQNRSKQNVSALQNHVFYPFVAGAKPWAPAFYGVCADSWRLYLVQENMMSNFVEPCQADLKLGFSTYDGFAAADDSWAARSYKRAKHAASDALTTSASKGVRLEGIRLFDARTNTTEKNAKGLMMSRSITDKLSAFLDSHKSVSNKNYLSNLVHRLSDMAQWWKSTGEAATYSIGLSALVAYECASRGKASDLALKLIDYAHFYPRKDTQSTQDDGVGYGLGQLAAKFQANLKHYKM